MDKIITVLGYKNFITEMSYAPDWTHSQRLLQNRLMDVYKTWQGWNNHGPAHAYRLFGQIRPEVEPRRRKNGSMRGPFFQKNFVFRSECNSNKPNASFVSWIEISWLFAVRNWFHKFDSHAFWFAKKSNF